MAGLSSWLFDEPLLSNRELITGSTENLIRSTEKKMVMLSLLLRRDHKSSLGIPELDESLKCVHPLVFGSIDLREVTKCKRVIKGKLSRSYSVLMK